MPSIMLPCVLSHFSRVRLFATLWTVACQAYLSMGFSRQEYWSVLPYFPPGDLPDPGIEPVSYASAPALAGEFFTTRATWEAHPFNQQLLIEHQLYASHGGYSHGQVKLGPHCYGISSQGCRWMGEKIAD